MRCDHEANLLLPWYLNGSLEGADAGAVEEHLGTCDTCVQELEILGEVGRHAHGEGPVAAAALLAPAGGRRQVRLAWGLAAALSVLALFGLFRTFRDFPTEWSGSSGGLEVVEVLRLGGGLTRGQTAVPSLEIPSRVRLVVLLFRLPPLLNAEFEVELIGPGGAILSRAKGPLMRDLAGEVTFSAGVDLFSTSGRYALVVRAHTPEGTERPYEFPFNVEWE